MERHDLDVLSLFAGLVFVAIAVVGLTDAFALTAADLRWIGPFALVAFGVVLVATAGRGRHTRADDTTADEPGA